MALLVLLGAALPLMQAQAPHGGSLTLEDLLAARPITESAVAPDGARLAFTRDGQIYTMPVGGGWPVEVTTGGGGKSGIAWSPDGKALAFASRGGIWTVAAAGGEPRRLTNAPPGTSGDPREADDRAPQWSPKGGWLLFTTGRRGHNSLMTVRADGEAESFVADPSEGGAEQGVWSPDGTEIAYVLRTREHFSGEIKVQTVDPAAGQPRGEPIPVYTAPVDRGGGWLIRGLTWTPDGKRLLAVLQAGGWDNVALLDAKLNAVPEALTKGEWEDEAPAVSPDGTEVAFVSNRSENGGSPEQRRVWVQPMHGGAAHLVAAQETPGIDAEPRWTPDGKQVVFRRESPLHPADLYTAPANGGEARALTHTLPGSYEGALQMPQRVSWKGGNGVPVAGVLYMARYTKPGMLPPAVLWIHGGPEGQDVFRLDVWAQYLADAGYTVLEPNYRGSTGYGEHFRNLSVRDSNGGDVDDIAAGAQFLIDRKLADPKRLAIGGGSHGGTMTAYMMVHYPALFAAAIEGYGVVDRALYVERSNPNAAIHWELKMGGSPSEAPDTYAKANVLLQVSKVQTPVLLLHGEDDPQVPPAESAEFAHALLAHGKTFFYFTYPGELHGFSKPEHQLDAWGKERAFLDHYIAPKEGMVSTDTRVVAFPKSAPGVVNAPTP